MKNFKNLGSKIITSMVMLVLMFSLVQLPVHASDIPDRSISDFEIVGKVGVEITPVIVTLNADNDTAGFGSWTIGYDMTNWFKMFVITNFPDGLKAIVAGGGDRTLTVSIEGTPTVEFEGVASLYSSFKENLNCSFHFALTHNVTVNGGTGSEKYAQGDTVTITADTPASGKQFKEWTVVSGGITLASSTSATTTFIMPANAVEVTAVYENIPTQPTPEKPVITAGSGATHQISNGKDMTITCSGKLEDLTGIYVDGKLVDPSNYTLKSGSTILTLKASYLDTLTAGKHTLKFQYKSNLSAETTITVQTKAGVSTGDTTNTKLYLGLIIVAGGVLVLNKRRKMMK